MDRRHVRSSQQQPLSSRTIEVAGVTRTFCVAPTPAARAARQAPQATTTATGAEAPPLLVAIHGLGMTGADFARWTDLARRGPAAGFLTVFPDALDRVWDDHGTGRRDGADDAAFITALIVTLTEERLTRAALPFLVGLSNGACFVERLARSGLLTTAGIALIAGTAREASHRATPRPVHPTAVLAMLGTADRYVPYEGGPASGMFRRLARRRVRRALTDPGGHDSIAAGVLAAEWAMVNDAAAAPSLERLAAGADGQGDDLAVERLTWAADALRSDSRPVVLYRIVGGGHGWPGGRSRPTRLFGHIPQRLDATRIVLDFAHQAILRAGEPIGPGP